MRGGKLRQLVSIRRSDMTGQDSTGAPIRSDVDVFANIHVHINPGRGREYESAKQFHTDLTHVVSMRAMPIPADVELNQCWVHVTPTRSNLNANRKLTILNAVNKDERGREYLLYCREDTY